MRKGEPQINEEGKEMTTRNIKTFISPNAGVIDNWVNDFVERQGVYIVDVTFQLHTMPNGTVQTHAILLYEEERGRDE